MIQKMTSHELNSILDAANDKLDKVISDVKVIKNDITKKLKVMRYESEFVEHQMKRLQDIHEGSSKNTVSGENIRTFTLLANDLSKKYEGYGSTVTSKFKSMPTNVFNILAAATGEAFFRDIAEVSINNIVKEEYKDILKHDSLDNKETFFEELTGDDPALDIVINVDTTKSLGSMLFNMIEFDPFLNGAYNIEYIRIYTQGKKDYTELLNFESAGKMRIILDKEYSLNKIEMRIVPKFSTQVNGVKLSPVGLKHIYFYNAKFVSDSYAIAVINSREYIDTINDSIVIKTPNEEIETSASSEGIEFYLNKTVNSNGEIILSSKQEPSKSEDTKLISQNVNEIYAKVPLSSKSIVGITFTLSTKVF